MKMTQDLHRLNRRLAKEFAAGNSDGFTLSQMLVLEAIRTSEGDKLPSQAALTLGADIDRSTLSDVVKRLAREGYAIRKDDKDDARAFCVGMTPKGAQLFAHQRQRLVKVEKTLIVEAKALVTSW